MFKKIIAIVLAVMLIISCIPATMATEGSARLDPTNGLFSENTKLTRGTFFFVLWRFCGCPEPTIENPYTDIYKSDFYYKAALWSIEAGITISNTETTYGPNLLINRAQLVTFLYRALAEENAEITENPFTDVEEDSYFYNTALWACSEGYISARNEPTLFAPTEFCYYGQIHWDKSAPAVDTKAWYGTTVTSRPIGRDVDVSFDEETGTLTFSGTGKMFGCQFGPDEFGNNTIAPWYSYADQVKSVVIEEGITSVGSYLFKDFPNLESVSIPDSITSFQHGAFSGCKSLESISIPSGLTSIGDGAFYGFKNLEGIVIPETVTEIGRCAFSGCKKITEANIPAGITVIKDRTFYGCEKLSRIYIPATVTTIELEAFDECPYLTDVFYGGTAGEWEQIQVDYTSYGGTNQVLKTANLHCMAEEPETGICGEDARWVLQSNGVLTISGTGPMYDYAQLEPTAIRLTADTAAAPWSSMRNRINTVVIQEGITHIGSNAFSDCKNLASAILPESVHSAGNSVFAGCDKLTNVYYGGTKENWDAIFDDTALDNSDIYVDMPDNPFVDVKPADYYCGSVLWAFENGITSGTDVDHFSPTVFCNRAQIVTFLWRAAGSPEPTQIENPFADVQDEEAYFYKAVLWAVEKGITNGTSDNAFSPLKECSRAQVVTFLYRAMGNPKVSAADCPFTDVASGAFYETPVLWAVENGITTGATATTFNPTGICSRAQVVTFLYRTYVN